MAADRDLQLVLHRAVDEVEMSPAIPPEIMRRARNQRGTRLVAIVAVAVIVLSYVAVSGTVFFSSLRIQPANRRAIPFTPLLVEVGSETEGLVGSPLAPAAFPDCTEELVDVRTDIGQDAVDVTIRPDAGVQCGLDWSPEALWVGADGERYVPPASRPPFLDGSRDDRLLLMGDNGASHWAVVAGPACELEAPIRYFITLGDAEVEVAEIEQPECSARRPKRTQPFRYRMGGIETPAGWLDAELLTPSAVNGNTLRFVLELTNDTDERIVLGRCPFFDATFVSGNDEAHLRSYLNCPAAPDAVEPTEEIRFRIELLLDSTNGSGHLELVLRDERRPLQRITSEQIQITE